MNDKSRLFGAPIAMRMKGEVTDSIVLEEITKKPGLTVSEIAGKLMWTNGKVDGSVNRLILKGKVLVKHCLKRGMLVKRVYPAECPAKPHNLIEIPKEMVDYDVWEESAIVYALARSAVGISHREIEEWDEKAFFKERISIEKNGESIIVKLPDRFSRFYQLENSDISLSTVGGLVLVTVESVLPVKLPPIYPEERATYAILKSEIIEGVLSYDPFLSVDLREGETKGIHASSLSLYAMVRKRTEEKISTTTSSESSKEPIKIPVKAK